MVEDYFTVAFGCDATCARVLHASHRAFNGGVHAAVFKSKVAVVGHDAIFHYKVVCIAQWLSARYFAIYEPKVVGVPPQVFASDFRVVNGYIFSSPESVFRVDYGIAYYRVSAILE